MQPQGYIEMNSHDGTSGHMQPLGYIEIYSHDGTSGHMQPQGYIEMDSHDGTGGHMQPQGYIEMDSHDGTGGRVGHPFFSNERSVLCILFCSFKKNVLFFAFFSVLLKRMERSFRSLEKNGKERSVLSVLFHSL